MSVSSQSTFNGDETEDVTIAVMGPTGTGKTSFINLLSGSDLRVGGQLESCTTAVQTAGPFELDGRRITLIDTPGFDDTSIKDTDVLKMIAAYLSFVHKQGKTLAGVIYMHRILDNRVGGISSRNFKMFRNICGDASLQNVVVVTNMWNKVDKNIGEKREAELANKDIFFKLVLDKGARLSRHEDTIESGQAILRSLLDRRPRILQIQRELEEGLDITQTAAGKELNRELMEQMARYREEMRELQEELKEASRVRDEETRKELKLEREKLQLEMGRIQAESDNLAAGFTAAVAKLEQKVMVIETDSIARATKKAEDENNANPHEDRALGRDNAVIEAKLAAALPVLGFWGKMAFMLAPFSLSWK